MPWRLQAAIQITHSFPLVGLGHGGLGGAEPVIYANLPPKENGPVVGGEGESFMKTFHDILETQGGRRDLREGQQWLGLTLSSPSLCVQHEHSADSS